MKAFGNAAPSQTQDWRDNRQHRLRKPLPSPCSFSPHLRFVDLRLYVEELDCLKPAVDKSRRSVEKTETQKIFVQEEQRWRGWESEEFGLQPASTLRLVAKKRGWQVAARCITMQPGLCFPVRILIVLAYVTRERLDIVVRDCILQFPGFSGHHHVLVNLGVSHRGVLIFKPALKMSFAATKKGKLVKSRRRAPQPPSQKMHAQFDVIAVVLGNTNSLSDLVFEFGGDRFISIE